ncbi:MAG: c-type cytochrome domain-containing protein [Lacibacter sp.]
MKKIRFIGFLLIVFIAACEHESLIPGGTPPPGITPPAVGASTICFETDVLPIFVSNCAKTGCHDVTTHAKGLRYDNYAEIMKTIKVNEPSSSEAWKTIMEDKLDKRMPPSPAAALDKSKKDSIYKWIVQGALNTTNCNTGCDTTFFTYSATILPTLQSSCIGCHSGGVPAGNIDLTTYSNVYALALSGKLLGAVSHAAGFKPMPNGGNKLPDCKITQIRKWIQVGAPNN